jgi:hypothetical protein
MSDILNASLDLSKLYKTLTLAEESFPFNYTVKSSPCPQSKIKVRTEYTSGELELGNMVSIEIPRTGINILSYLKVDLSGFATTSNDIGDVHLGFGGVIFLFRKIELVMSDTIICTLLPHDILATILSLPESERDSMLSAVGSNASSPFKNLFLPLYFSCYEELQNSIDTKELQQFNINVYFTDSIYDICWSAMPDSNTALPTNSLVLLSNLNMAIGMLPNGRIQTVSYGDMSSILQIIFTGVFTIDAINYNTYSIFSPSTQMYLSPYGQTSTVCNWLNPSNGIYLFNDNGTVGQGIQLSSLLGEKVSFVSNIGNVTQILQTTSTEHINTLTLNSTICIRANNGNFLVMAGEPNYYESAGTNSLPVAATTATYQFRITYLSELMLIQGRLGYQTTLQSVAYPARAFGVTNSTIPQGGSFIGISNCNFSTANVFATMCFFPIEGSYNFIIGEVSFLSYLDGNLNGSMQINNSALIEIRLSTQMNEWSVYECSPNNETFQSIDTFVPTSLSLESIFVVPQQPDYFEMQKQQFKLPKSLETLWSSSEREIPTPEYYSSQINNYNNSTQFGINYSGKYMQADAHGASNYVVLTLPPSQPDWRVWGAFYANFYQDVVTFGDNYIRMQFYLNDSYHLTPNYVTMGLLNGNLGWTETGTSVNSFSGVNTFILIPYTSGISLIHIGTGSPIYWTGEAGSPFALNPQNHICTFDIKAINASNDVVFNVPINTKKLVHSTQIMVRLKISNVNKTPLASSIGIDGNYVPISSVEFSGDSEILLKYDATELQVMQSREYNRFHSRNNSSNTFDNIYTVEYGMYKSKTQNSGGINFNNLRDAQLKVVLKDAVIGNYELIVVHNYWKFMETDGGDMKMSTSYDY